MPQAFRRNPTVFSTEFLDNVTPVFLIRHPALSIPSFYRKDITICKNRADDEDFAVYVALYWSRLIFDSFALRSGSEAKVPIVVDAADVIYNTELMIRALCARLGIDYSGVQFSWTPLPEHEWPESPVMRAYFADLFRSNGLERRADKPAEETMDLDARQREWREEFGSEDAKTLRLLVDGELEHYEYLQKFKLQA